MKNREELCKALSNKIKADLSNKKVISERASILNDKFKIPVEISSDILTMRTDILFVEDYLLYCLMTAFGMGSAKNYFEDAEINSYKVKKYSVEKFTLPIRIPMMQVNPDQWIGTTTAQELMTYRKAELLNYNPETQRAMKIIKTETGEIFQPYVNKNSVSKISKSMESEDFTPNTITLNMPETTDFEFVPEYGNFGTLIIKSIEHFDMIDGYHRYLALSDNYFKDENFNYPMELRIFSFSESKSRQFIFQEDQKTKMKRVDSESYNQNKYANQIINMVNESTGITKGMFARSSYIINPALASDVIDKNKFVGRRSKVTPKDLITERNDIINKLNLIFEEDNNIFEKRWDDKFTIVMFGLFMNNIETDLVKKAKKIVKKVNKDYSYMFRNNNVSKQDSIRLNNIISED